MTTEHGTHETARAERLGAHLDVPAVALPGLEDAGPPRGERFREIVLPDQWGATASLHTRRAGRKALVVFIRSADW